jgi:hypothetical protein
LPHLRDDLSRVGEGLPFGELEAAMVVLLLGIEDGKPV